MSRSRKPDWLKMRPPSGERFTDIKRSLRERDLHTVCEEANCPNMGECWSGENGPGTATLIDAEPDVLAHNIETVDRLQWPVRDRRAGYEQSLSVLRQTDRESDVFTKTSLMLGVGEYAHEVYQTLSDLRQVGTDIVTFGQYLQPSRSHLEVSEYVHPDVFDTWQRVAEEEFDFQYCASGPMVRSSYRAGELFVESVLRNGESVDDARRRAQASD